MLTFDANYGELADCHVQNLTDSIWIKINHIDGNLVIHESDHEDEVFHPVQFHFHSPSEHTIDGRHYDLEMHFYHITADQNHHSVIAVFFDTRVGGEEESEFISSIFQTPDNSSVEGLPDWVPIKIHMEKLLKKLDRTKLFHYDGSLTVPPCTENVEWNIIDDPQPISKQ